MEDHGVSLLSTLKTSLAVPLKLFSESLLSSGTSSPRMALSRTSSLSSISPEEEAIRKMEADLSLSLKLGFTPSASPPLSAEANAGRQPKLPYDVIWLILTHVARRCRRVGNNADLLRCALVDKR